MITRFARITSRLLVAFTFLFTVAACGGGGGGNGGFIPDDGSGGTNYILTLTLTDPDGNPTDTVTATSPVTLTVLVTRRGDKTPVAQVVVTTVLDIGTLLPATGTALTDGNGHAVFSIGAGETLGAGTALVSVDSPDDGAAAFTAEISFRVGQAGLRLGHFEGSNFIDGAIGLVADQLAAGGSALLQFAVVDENGALVDTIETIQITSGCSADVLETQTANGQATAAFTATGGCSGLTEITGVLQSNGAVATGSITIAPPEADVIEYVGVVPETGIISLKGTGTTERPETATISFRVRAGEASLPDPDDPNDPGSILLPGIPVAFTIAPEVGGLTLQNSSGVTDANGVVKATIHSGNVATSVTVTAIIQTDDGDGPSTASSPIAVSTGVPDQNSISISAEHLNVQGALDFDWRESVITVHMADRFNNPVADGTTIVFTTEYGAIDASCRTGVRNGDRYEESRGTAVPFSGDCSVLWNSQAPRFPVFNQDLVQTIFSTDYNCPSHNGGDGQGIPCPDDLGAIRGLRTTILATAVGDEYFADNDGNGYYSEGEPFENLPEAFVDWNEDRVHTPTLGPQCPNPPSSAARCEAAGADEPFTDFNGDDTYSLNDDPAWYNGSLCPPEGDGIWCSSELVDVRADIVLVMSSEDDFYIVLVNARTQRIVTKVEGGDRYIAYISDRFNNAPAAAVDVVVSGCGLDTTTNAPNTNSRGAFGVPLTVAVDGTDGNFTITAGATSKTFFCDFVEPEPEPEPEPDSNTPVAVDDSYGTTQDTLVTTGNVLVNDDLGDTPTTITAFDAISANSGTVVNNGDGTFDYTPDTGFNGADTFTYTITDDDGETSRATVTIAVI